MRTTRAARTWATTPLLFVILSVSTLAGPAPVGPSLAGTEPSAQAPAQAPEGNPLPPLAVVHAELEGLEGAAFTQRVDHLLRAEDPTVVLDALVLRAGRPSPAGLTGARADRRQARREEALAWMDTHDVWFSRARDLVAGADTDEDLRCAALTSLGEAGQLRAARDLAWALDAGRFSDRVRECARASLVRLTGRRFTSSEEFTAATAGWSARTREGIFAEELLAKEREAEGLMIELLEHQPARISETLQNGSPTLRAAAARALARGVGRQGGSLDDALDLLTERLTLEHDARALHATLDALIGLVEGMPADAPAVLRLRGLLFSETFARRLEISPSVAGALARMPWNEDGGEDGGHTEAARRIGALVAELADETRPMDYEAVSLSLDALQNLLDHTPEGSLARGAVDPARQVLLDLLARADAPVQVRLEAAKAAGWVLSGDSLELLLDTFDVTTSSRLHIELLGSVARLTPEVDPAGPAAGRLLSTLERLIRAEGADLRRRAIEQLAAPSFEPLRGRARSEGLPLALVARLGEEPQAGLRDALLEALAKLGPADDAAGELVGLANFDQLLDENHRRPQRMARCLRALVGDDAAAALAAARRLARDQRGTPPETAPSPVDRLRAALSIAMGPQPDRVVAWAPADHAAVIGWALELLAGEITVDLPVLDRLVGVHLDHASGVGLAGAARLMAARDLGRLAVDAERDVPKVEAAFAGALGAAAGDGAAELRLERARWRLAAGDVAGSVEDWDALLFTASAKVPAQGLAPADMRRARVAYATDPARATRVALALITDPAWSAIDPGERLADLLAAADLAMESGDEMLIREAARHLAGVPAPVQGVEQLPEFPAGTRWASTLQRPTDHVALYRRVVELAQALDPNPPAEEDDGGDEAGEAEQPGPDDPGGF